MASSVGLAINQSVRKANSRLTAGAGRRVNGLMMRVRMGSWPRIVELGSTQARDRGLAQVAGPAAVLRGGRDVGAHEMKVRPSRKSVARLCRPELEAR